jgi:hypothetical protein
MPQKSDTSSRTELNELSRKQAEVAEACGRIFKALDPLLRKERVGKLNLERMIFSRMSKGVVIHLPVRLGDKVTKKDLYTGAHAIGVLANTIPLFDRVRQTALAPDFYLVKVRAISKCAWAFDFIRADGRTALSTPANLVEPRRFASLPDKEALRGGLWGVPGFDVYVGEDPDTLLPDPNTQVCCISLLYWFFCFGIALEM